MQNYPENIQTFTTREGCVSFYGDLFSKYSNMCVYAGNSVRVVNHEFVYPCSVSAPASGVALKPNRFQPPNDSNTYIFSFFNNHCNDFDLNSLIETQRQLESAGHICIPSSQLTKNCLVIEHEQGSKIGVAFACERETFAQNREIPEIFVTSQTLIDEQVTQLKKFCDFVVVYIHWGDEFHVVPNKRQLHLGRLLLDKGCLVVGHHAHIPQIYLYNKSHTRIYYGLGNYSFDDLDLENNSLKMDRKWRFFNRASISVSLDLRTLKVSHRFLGESRYCAAIFIYIFKALFLLNNTLALYINKKTRSLLAKFKIRLMN